MNCKPEEECMRNLEALYDEFKAIGALKYTPESYKKYNKKQGNYHVRYT